MSRWQFTALFFFFNDTATTEIYTLSLHDALPISDMHIYNWDAWAQKTIPVPMAVGHEYCGRIVELGSEVKGLNRDRKSTRLNSSHSQISYAVFCLKKKTTHLLYSSRN